MKLNFSQIIEKFNQLDVKIRIGIFIGCLLGLLVIDFFTLIGIQLGALQKMDIEYQAMKQDIEKVKMDLQRSGQIKTSVDNSKAELEKLNQKIRPLSEQSLLMEEVSRIASDAGVKIEQLSPQSDPQLVPSPGVVKYYSLPVVIQATCGYHAWGRFIGQLEDSNLFFTVNNLSMEEREGDAKNHTVNAVLKFILSDKSLDKK
jgi:Tfp pilus assembly protein PilO